MMSNGRLHMVTCDGEILDTIAIQDDSFPTSVAVTADHIAVLCALVNEHDLGPGFHTYGLHAVHLFKLCQ